MQILGAPSEDSEKSENSEASEASENKKGGEAVEPPRLGVYAGLAA